MQPTDKAAFGVLLTGYLQEIYDKPISAALLSVWFSALAGHALNDIEAAFARYVASQDDCRFPPKPGDIIRHLSAAVAVNDGRPGPDEAWGMLLRVARDEAETGVLSEEMREAWFACGPTLDEGDEVGARRCFIEVYWRRVQAARERHEPARWTATLGTDKALRQQGIEQAVKLGRIGADQARALLPGPSTASLEQVAGLLEAPDAPPDAVSVSKRLRGLIEIINNAGAAADDQRKAEEAARREREQTERARVLQELNRRGGFPGGGLGENTGEEAA